MTTNKVDLSVHQQALARFRKTQQTEPDARPKDAESTNNEALKADRAVAERFERSEIAERYERTESLHAAGMKAVGEQPDIREERLEEVRERLLNGDYDSEKVREQVAESLERVMKLLDLFVS